MRNRFSKLSIGRKLQAINLLTVTLIAVLTTLSQSIFLYQSQMEEQHKAAISLIHVLADNLNSTLLFNDAKTAALTLEGLEQTEDVRYASLYNTAGQLFASYRRKGVDQQMPTKLSTDAAQTDTHYFKTSHEVALKLLDPSDNRRASR